MTVSLSSTRPRSLFRRHFLVGAIAIWVGCAAHDALANYAAIDLFVLGPPPGVDPTEIVVANAIQPPVDYVPQAAAGGQVVGRTTGGGFGLLWNHSSQPIVLGSIQEVLATNGNQQVGDSGSSPTHAMLWDGSQASAVDLNPSNLNGITQTWAFGTSGTQQVGVGAGNDTPTGPNLRHALLWNGTAASAVDLNPAGSAASWAYGTDGAHQVGQAFIGGAHGHAVLWNGTAASAVDLNPTDLAMPESGAVAVSGNQQVGFGSSDSAAQPHALLWQGTAGSAVDLNPSGFNSSFALATNGRQQVGYGQGHALLWNGTAASAVDLGALLSPTTLDSKALSIDSAGDVYGVALFAPDTWHAVEWVPIPEPSLIWLVGAAMAAAVVKRRR